MSGQVSRYHPALAALHWVLAFLIIADLAIGAVVLVHIPNDAPKKLEGLRAHMGAGLAILALMALRLGVRVRSDKPAHAPTGSALLDRVAWLSHRMLYTVVFGMIASGLVMALQAHAPQAAFLHQGKLPASFWVFPLRTVHFVLSRVLMTLIALHFAGALYHTLVRRDGLLGRMWFGRRRDAVAAAPGGQPAITPWVSRAILTLTSLLFADLASRYLVTPAKAASASGMTLTRVSAATDLRVEAALFLALAGVIAWCVVSGRRLLGLGVLAAAIGTVTAARILGAALDGAAHETLVKLTPELVLSALTAVGLALELGRRRRLRSTDEGSVLAVAVRTA